MRTCCKLPTACTHIYRKCTVTDLWIWRNEAHEKLSASGSDRREDGWRFTDWLLIDQSVNEQVPPVYWYCFPSERWYLFTLNFWFSSHSDCLQEARCLPGLSYCQWTVLESQKKSYWQRLKQTLAWITFMSLSMCRDGLEHARVVLQTADVRVRILFFTWVWIYTGMILCNLNVRCLPNAQRKMGRQTHCSVAKFKASHKELKHKSAHWNERNACVLWRPEPYSLWAYLAKCRWSSILSVIALLCIKPHKSVSQKEKRIATIWSILQYP